MTTATPDVTVTREGNIFLFHLLTEAAESFLDHVGDEAQTFGNALVVDQHCAEAIVFAMREDFGLEVR